MYLWKVDSLVEDFKAGKVSQKEEFKYMLFYFIAMALAIEPYFYIGYSYNYYDTLGSIVNLVISISGVYYCYTINSKGDNKDFIVRMMCIGTPVLIRVLVAMILVLIPLTFVLLFLESEILPAEYIDSEFTETTLLEVVVVSFFSVVYFWYLSNKLKAVSINSG